jgi:hypothetical protein
MKKSLCRPSADPAAKDEMTGMTPAGCIEVSGQGPKRAIDIARPLRIQPGINNTEDSSSRRPVAKVVQPQKLQPLLLATAVSQAVGRRRCCCPRLDGGRLQRAAQKDSFARTGVGVN